MDTARTARLATQRLVLRPLGPDDGDALRALLVQPGVRRHLFDGIVPGRAEVDAMAVESGCRFGTCGAGLWLAFEIARPQAPAGLAGFWRFEQGGGRPPVDELVFALDESCWGRGLATEASRAVLGYARDVLGWTEARASADDGNLASARTLVRIGFREYGQAFRPGSVLRLFRKPLQ